MGILDNYLQYRKNKPYYKDWANERAVQEAKRINYLKKNNIDPASQKNDIERAKTVLNAIDVMDEFSQSRAEEMEMTVQTATSSVVEIGTYLGMGLAALSLLSKNIKEAVKNLEKNKKFSPVLAIPALLYIIPSFGSGILMSIFSAKQETRASRLGRAEAINKKLTSPKQFAILTPEQNNQVAEIAKGINITEKEVKKQEKITRGFGVINSIKTLIKGNKESEAKLKELNAKFNKDLENAKSDKPLSEEQIKEAKKDRQLVQNVVEKIDIASQEYAEDAELATTTFTLLALSSGGALGALTKFILNKAKVPAQKANIISVVTGALVFLAGAAWSTSVQKQASRVARYKVKQDFLSAPEKLVYVDDEKIKNEPDAQVESKKKPNFFKFLVQVYKDNKEYNQYKKENRVKQAKLSQALEQIEITPEQEKRAKQLQNNVFKMFNKVDEKSQTFSESTEALGEIVLYVGSLATMIPGVIGYAKNIFNGKIFKGLACYAASIIPIIALNIYVTKEQKAASKVADMLATKELDDYKNFADYSIDAKEVSSAESKKSTEAVKNSIVEQFLKQRALSK